MLFFPKPYIDIDLIIGLKKKMTLKCFNSPSTAIFNSGYFPVRDGKTLSVVGSGITKQSAIKKYSLSNIQSTNRLHF
jgi:hypothetical protein